MKYIDIGVYTTKRKKYILVKYVIATRQCFSKKKKNTKDHWKGIYKRNEIRRANLGMLVGKKEAENGKMEFRPL